MKKKRNVDWGMFKRFLLAVSLVSSACCFAGGKLALTGAQEQDIGFEYEPDSVCSKYVEASKKRALESKELTATGFKWANEVGAVVAEYDDGFILTYGVYENWLEGEPIRQVIVCNGKVVGLSDSYKVGCFSIGGGCGRAGITHWYPWGSVLSIMSEGKLEYDWQAVGVKHDAQNETSSWWPFN